MPRCRKCGNDDTIASSLVPPASDTANAPPYGLVANFDQGGSLTTMECQGASLDDAQEAYEDPEHYFDTCPICGAKDIEW
ncbi:hypothetical protein [Desulfofalx alkaliphila]|uniref:hypothetical protein n=1 Tax=Desulfofalx alkaliphila TaxID=105483 RepID=UPI0004E25EA7|nr:hypothetical protein [Desulfofalx alkaliphila]